MSSFFLCVAYAFWVLVFASAASKALVLSAEYVIALDAFEEDGLDEDKLVDELVDEDEECIFRDGGMEGWRWGIEQNDVPANFLLNLF